MSDLLNGWVNYTRIVNLNGKELQIQYCKKDGKVEHFRINMFTENKQTWKGMMGVYCCKKWVLQKEKPYRFSRTCEGTRYIYRLHLSNEMELKNIWSDFYLCCHRFVLLLFCYMLVLILFGLLLLSKMMNA